MYVKILRKRWKLTFERLPHKRHEDAGKGPEPNGARYGDCFPPDSKDKRIRISDRLRGRHQLEVIAHEVLHAAWWALDEDFVRECAEDLGRVLWRLGYRKVEGIGDETNKTSK